MKKASTRARGLRTCWTSSCGESSETLRFARLQGLFHAALSGSRGSVARADALSNGFVEPNEAPLASLENRPGQPLARDVQLVHRVAVELDPALGDEAASLARREAERFGEQRGQVNRIAGRQRVLGQLLGCLPTPDDAGEVLLGLARRLLP